MTSSKLVVEIPGAPLTDRIGFKGRLSKKQLLSGEWAESIREVLIRSGVLCFPAVGLSDEEQMQFARTLGEIAHDWDVSADKSVNSNMQMAEYQRASLFWHFDGAGVPVPEFATMMSPRRLAYGTSAATEFANCYAAYEDLSNDDKSKIDSLWVRHTFETQMRNVNPSPGPAELKAWREGGHDFVHPLVWHHKSGRNSLLLGASSTYIEGMEPDESSALLRRLLEWATRPENVYSYDWQIGDVVIWDNTGTLHRAAGYGSNSKRLMHRTTIRGFEAPA